MKKPVKQALDVSLETKGFYLGKPPKEADVNFGTVARQILYKTLFDSVTDIDGAVVECGVGTGTSLFLFCTYAAIEGKNRAVYGYDSFEGFPDPTDEDTSVRNPKKGTEGRGWATDPKHLKNVFIKKFQGRPGAESLKLVKGYFEDSFDENNLSELQEVGIAFLHLDVDLYASYKVTLERLWPLVKVGGVVLFDEHLADKVKFPGSVKAIDEFFGDLKVQIQHDRTANRYYIFKK